MKKFILLFILFCGTALAQEKSDCPDRAYIAEYAALQRDKGVAIYDTLAALLRNGIPPQFAQATVEFVYDHPKSRPKEFYAYVLKRCEYEERKPAL